MFILRRVLPCGTEENTEIGDFYRLITKKTSLKAFELLADDLGLADSVCAIIYFCPMIPYKLDGESYIVIPEDIHAYIMSESGQTFARIN